MKFLLFLCLLIREFKTTFLFVTHENKSQNKEGKQCEIAKEPGLSTATISRGIKKYKECTLYDTSKVGDIG